MIQSSDREAFLKQAENTGAERLLGGRTYLYFTVKTVSEDTLLPISFAPVSKLDQTVEKPGMINDFSSI